MMDIRLFLTLLIMIICLDAREIPQIDIGVHIGESIKFGDNDAKIVRFGGYTTPECKLAISLDGKYFYLKKLNSTCVKLTNSKGVKIICNSDRSVCKTRQELAQIVNNQSMQTEEDSSPSWCSANRLNKTEHAICADETLGMLDKKMAKLYGAIKAHTSYIEQRKWLKKRNKCDGDTICIRQAYENRITQLIQKYSSNNHQKVDEKVYDELYDAIKAHDIVKIDSLLLKKGIDLNYSDKKVFSYNNLFPFLKKSRGTPLYYAISLGYFDIARILINHGADINANMEIYSATGNSKIRNYATLLAQASKDLPMSSIKKIIALGGDVKKISKEVDGSEQFAQGDSPLYRLVQNPNVTSKMVAYFLEQGANVDYGNEVGLTPLDALFESHEDSEEVYKCAKILLENKANPNKSSYGSRSITPMLEAARYPLKYTKLLIKYGGSIDLVTSEGNTMLHEVNNIELAKYLIEHGLKKYINRVNDDGEYPIEHFFLEIDDENEKLITYFIKQGAKVDIRDKNNGDTLIYKLNFQTENDFPEDAEEEVLRSIRIAKVLIDHGLDRNIRNKEGKTILDEVYDSIEGAPDSIQTRIINFLYSYKPNKN